jgi:hypothetical protein
MTCTYINISVTNFTGLESLSTYTLDVTPFTFVASLSSNNLSISDQKGLWNFGDGTISTSLSTNHSYTWPGVYNVTFYGYTSAGNTVQACRTFQVTAVNYVGDFIHSNYLNDEKIASYNSGQVSDPIEIVRYNSWQSLPTVSATGYTINFYASGSKSDYLQLENYVKDPWAHLQSYFFFVEKVGNRFGILSSAVTTADPIYVYVSNNQIVESTYPYEGSTLAGTSGTTTIYYVDQYPKNLTSEAPIFLYASLDVSLFPSRNEIPNLNYTENFSKLPYINYSSLVTPVKIRYNPAQTLSITSNGIDGEGYTDESFYINKIKWQNYPISFFIKLKDSQNYTTKQYPLLNFNRSTDYFDLTCDLISVCSQKVMDGIHFYKNNNIKNINRTGGFYAGYLNSPYAIENVALTASVKIYDPAYFAKDSPYAWLGQGLDSYSISITSNADIASNIYRYNKFREYDACKETISLQLTGTKSSPTVFAGILKNPFAIAVSPSEDDAVWFADSDRDRILKLKKNGEIIFDIDLSNAPRIYPDGNVIYQNFQGSLSGATPSSIALDGQANAWVTLYTAGSCLRIQRDTGYIDAEAYPTYPNVDFSILHSFSGEPIDAFSGITIESFLNYGFGPLSGIYADESTILPSCIETDLDSNIWVTYSNPLKGYLIKYDPNGNFLGAKEYPTLFSPQQLLIDRDNNLYMTVMTYLNNNSSITNRNDFLYKYESNSGNLSENYPLSGYSGLGPLAVDKDQNIYASYNKQDILRVKTGTDTTTFSVGSGTNLTTEYQSINAIACDTENILWVVHNFDRRVYLYPLNSFTVLNTVDVNRINTDDVDPSNLRAYGDWTGMRWINKYYYNTRTRTVTGQSNTFNIYPVSGGYGLAKINENFDAIGNIKSYVLQESLLNKNVLFDQFLGPIVGNKNSAINSLGKRIYEKIANFVSNNADLDANELEALQSMESLIGVDLQNYNFPFPPDMQRLVNLLGTKLSYFRGSPNLFDSNYDKKQTISNPNYGKNLGKQLSWSTSTVPTSGKVVLYEKFGEVYSDGILTNYGVSQNAFLSGSTRIVHLSDVNTSWGWPLVLGDDVTGGIEVSRYYDVFEYNEGNNNLFYNNLIDWDSEKTTVSQTISTYSDWFDTNNIADNLINYQLSLGLGLLSSGN